MSQVEEQQTIWRVVFPSSNVGLDESFRISAAPIYGSGRRLASHSEASDVDNVMLHSWIVSRAMLEIPAGCAYSTGCYYNAFPAAYWAKWTGVCVVTLRMSVRGEATVIVHRSDSLAHDHVVSTTPVLSREKPQSISVDIQIGDMADGGWLWFDVEAGNSGSVTLSDAVWMTDSPAKRQLTASLAITTMNKPQWCIRQFNLLADMADMSLIDAVYVIDQGTR